MKKVKILVYLSTATEVPYGKANSQEAGIFLNELVKPLMPLYEAGHQIDFISRHGKTSAIVDKASFNLICWRFSKKQREKSLDFLEKLYELGMLNPMKVSRVLKNPQLLSSYDVLFIPGGQTSITDVLYKNWSKNFLYNKKTGELLLHFHQNNKITATIGHGSATLAAAPSIEGRWIYSGYKMTCVSMLAQRLVEDVSFFNSGGHMYDYPIPILRRRGGIVQNLLLGKSLVIEDRELITGQDSTSADELGRKLKNKIDKYLSVKV